MSNSGKKIRLSFNSPVILGFTIICFIVLILDKLTGSASTRTFFSVYRSSLASPFTYIRFFGHVFGHASWDHFFGNIMMLLVVGPLLEEKYGSANILFVILTTALVTGVINFIFFPQCPASWCKRCCICVYITCILNKYWRRKNPAYIYSGCTDLYRAAGVWWHIYPG